MAVRLLSQVLRETMTPDERQALREKHAHSDWNEDDYLSRPYLNCKECGEVGYNGPCDVIKVLDATENLKFNDLKVKVECDHWVTVKRSGQYGYASSVSPEYWTHTYCPKCGEKL